MNGETALHTFRLPAPWETESPVRPAQLRHGDACFAGSKNTENAGIDRRSVAAVKDGGLVLRDTEAERVTCGRGRCPRQQW